MNNAQNSTENKFVPMFVIIYGDGALLGAYHFLEDARKEANAYSREHDGEWGIYRILTYEHHVDKYYFHGTFDQYFDDGYIAFHHIYDNSLDMYLVDYSDNFDEDVIGSSGRRM